MMVAVVIGLIIAGLLLIVVEVLVIPGFGVIGLFGIAAIVGAGYLAYTELNPMYSGVAIASGVIGSVVLLWWLPKTRAGKAMVLDTQTLGTAANPELKSFVGREGVSVTPLRPSGTVEIDERPVDVVTDGEYVESGTRVRVVRVEGSRVVVETLLE